MNAETTYAPVTVSADRATPYADLVRGALQEASAPLSVRELEEKLDLSERLVRDGLERLISSGAVTVTRRFVPHRRGTPPLVYALRNS